MWVTNSYFRVHLPHNVVTTLLLNHNILLICISINLSASLLLYFCISQMEVQTKTQCSTNSVAKNQINSFTHFLQWHYVCELALNRVQVELMTELAQSLMQCCIAACESESLHQLLLIFSNRYRKKAYAMAKQLKAV